jgi:hypothetical protein
VRIYFAAALVDMRKGIDALRALVEDALKIVRAGEALEEGAGPSANRAGVLGHRARGPTRALSLWCRPTEG